MSINLYEQIADRLGFINLIKYCLTGEEYHHIIPHYHNANEIIFVEEGKYVVRVGDEEKVLKKGELAFIGSLVPHSFKSSGKAIVHAFIFGKDISDFILGGKVLPTFMEEKPVSKLLKTFFDSTCKDWENADYKYKRGVIYTLFGMLLTAYPLMDKVKDGASEFIAEVMKYINENYKTNISLKKLAYNFGYTESYFSRRFNNFTGMSLREYINRKRVYEAVKLHNENKDMPLSKIGLSVGFDCLNTFYRVYYKYIND